MPTQTPFYSSLAAHGSKVALIDGNRHFSYLELDRLSNQFVEKIGDKRQLVFLESTNTIEAVAAYLACLKGRHPVYLYSSDDLAQTRILMSLYSANLDLTIDESGTVKFSRLTDEDIDLHPDLRVLLSTSGSTGSPKFVKLSERNIDSNARSIVKYLHLTSDDRAATTLKFNYSYGLSVLNSHLAAGASLWLSKASVTSSSFWDEMEAQHCTSFAGVPYTFEVLATLGEDWARKPSLRYVTQAGGKLSQTLVTSLARLGERNGWEFFVMYGQTEASPRMAYLPPALTAQFPDCIGHAVPGGTLELRDPAGFAIMDKNVEGELVYKGPNVMMGYAENIGDLATDETPVILYTGDIAIQNDAGLFKLLGRTSRFVKPFGRRVNLDDVQAAAQAYVASAACTGGDDLIVIAIEFGSASKSQADELLGNLAHQFQLPPSIFLILVLEQIPRLATGKTDYNAILANAPTGQSEENRINTTLSFIGILRALVTPSLYRDILTEAQIITGMKAQKWKSVADIFRTLFTAKAISNDTTFISLAGDSLTYVQCAIALEDYIGYLPPDWPDKSVLELESLCADAITF